MTAKPDTDAALPFEVMLAALPIEGDAPLTGDRARALYAKARRAAGLDGTLTDLFAGADTGAALPFAGAADAVSDGAVPAVRMGEDGPTAVLYRTPAAAKKPRRVLRYAVGFAAALAVCFAALALRDATRHGAGFWLGGSSTANDAAQNEMLTKDAAPQSAGDQSTGAARISEEGAEDPWMDIYESDGPAVAPFSLGDALDQPEDSLDIGQSDGVVQYDFLNDQPLRLPAGAECTALIQDEGLVQVDFMLEQAVYTLHCTQLTEADDRTAAADDTGGVLVVVQQADGSRTTYWLTSDWRFELESPDADADAFAAVVSAMSATVLP